MNTLHAPNALLPGGWATDVRLCWDAQGRLTQVTPDTPAPGPGSSITVAPGPVLPGMPNLHSHAFQRAFAGLTENRGRFSTGVSADADSFWSWRTRMYGFAQHLTPAEVEAIATWLYVEMVEAGYTRVCEFHYLHHDTEGRPYADDAELARALMRAAQRVGLPMTLLPVLYQTRGFGGLAPLPEQRRFIRSTQSMLRLLETLAPDCAAQGVRLGVAPHSLRAVPPESLRELLVGLEALDPTAPIHIHIAEQTGEVDACLAWSGQRPVAWLLDHAPVDARWCLVHATHLDEQEAHAAAARGAVAGLCPTTEANLGDGCFDLPRWQGAWGLGSDSHVCVSPAQEVMWLEYSQRLQRRQRNVGATHAQPHTATALWLQAVQGGMQASGQLAPGASAGLSVGQSADWVGLDGHAPLLEGLPSAADQLSAHVFATSGRTGIAQTWVAGRCLTETPQPHARHPLHDSALAAFVATRQALLQRMA